jgi:hypothetical protein
MKNWQQLAARSELQTVQAIKQSLDEGELAEVEEGLNQLLDTMARSEERALKSQLVRLMLHVLKWQWQPEKRSRSWLKSIYQARYEIADIQDYVPSLNRSALETIWERALRQASKEAEIETGVSPKTPPELTWKQVFEDAYQL